jgi:hypothetical protein
MSASVVTVNDILDGQVKLDIACLDRIYLNVYMPKLQTSGQVTAFLTHHLGFPFPSPALFNQIGQRFRRAVASYADANNILGVKFAKGESPFIQYGYSGRARGQARRAVHLNQPGHAESNARNLWMSVGRDTLPTKPSPGIE